MKNILPHLDNTVQEIYRKALDADAQLAELKKQGMAKFTSIFPDNQLFGCSEQSFMPYVAELSEDVTKFHQTQDGEELTRILRKMEHLLKVLGALRNITNGN